MRRREFIAGLGSALTITTPNAWAQRGERLPHVVILPGANIPEAQYKVAAFRRRLEGHGWIEDRNLRLDVHWWAPNPDRMRHDLAEIIARKPNIVVTGTSVAIAEILRTSAISVVFASITDPVGQGFVKSLASPGGNATGFAAYEVSLGGKWIEILKEISPSLVRAAVLYEPLTAPYMADIVRSIVTAGPSFGIELTDMSVRNIAELESAVSDFGRVPNSGLIVPPAHFTLTNFELINALAAKHRLPAIYAISSVVAAGGLIAYGVDGIDQFAKAADYVNRLLRGAKPADLPVQQPTKFELTINLKTAKTLGLAVPPTLLARADTVLE